MKFSVRGFTLIELLIVMAVIGVLAASVLFILNPLEQLAKAHDSSRKNDLSQIQNALESYYSDNGSYPPTVSFGGSFSPYMTKVPNDPKDPETVYVYYLSADGQSYYLYASLERSVDSGACNAGAACVSLSANSLSETACGKICNYGVSSPNVTP